MNLKCLVLAVVPLFGLGCNQLDDQTRKQAQIQGQEQANRQVSANNEDLQRKSDAMEADLETRERFYEGVSGIYEGQSDKARKTQFNLNVRFIVTSTLPYTHVTRVRALEEIISDMNNLSLTVQEIHSDPRADYTDGCTFVGVKPDLTTGEIQLAAPDCPNAFTLWLSENAGKEKSARASASRIRVSSSIAADLLAGGMDHSTEFWTLWTPTKDPNTFQFPVERVSP